MQQAQGLRAAVDVGRAGVTTGVVEQVRRALDSSELVKVRVRLADGKQVDEAGRALSRQCGAELVGRVGKMVVLYGAGGDS